MTKTLSMNDSGDIFAVGGTLQIATDIDAAQQTCERYMKVILGEMTYAADQGVNYFDNVFGSSPDVLKFEADARVQLARVDDVTGIESFEASVQDNQLSYTAVIRTIYGTTTISNSINTGT